MISVSLEEMNELRIEADWRFGKGLDKDHPNKKYSKYFLTGKLDEKFLQEWVKKAEEAQMPSGIVDEREGNVHLMVGAVA
ncbi:hypothetical protein BCR16_17005 [Ralstonia solanacearum FJAT-1458]|nr:hypothetical protein BCR16_17005 [Ralstonia solanacearum FJAT-1458]